MNAGNNDAAAAATCAVCSHLGKQCDETCILAPYFPLYRDEDFKYVHKIYGIHNLKQIVSSVDENERATTVETLILEAKWRVHDLVHGSIGVEKRLRAQWRDAVKELNLVREQLRLLRGPAPSSSDQETDHQPSHLAGPSKF